MTDTDTRLSIGAFSRASRLSIKALRLYGELGLLPPAHVDPLSGYRFYSPAQLDTARLIGLLRQLDLPLGDVQALLDRPPALRAATLSGLWGRVEREHGRRRALAQYLTEQFQGETDMTDPFEIHARFVPAARVATLTRRVYVGALTSFIGEAGARLTELLGEQAAGPALVLFHGEVNADSDGPVEVCLPFTGTLAVPDDVTVREEPAHTEAFVTLTRAQFEFPGILRAYDAVAGYAREHGGGCGLSPREVYPYPWAGLGEDDLAGEVAWPFTPHSAERQRNEAGITAPSS